MLFVRVELGDLIQGGVTKDIPVADLAEGERVIRALTARWGKYAVYYYDNHTRRGCIRRDLILDAGMITTEEHERSMAIGDE